ncbi:MAG TPA: PilN domain-containing protein [Flavobacterium sp.]|jgi:Tfp pilus assembly protein PilN
MRAISLKNILSGNRYSAIEMFSLANEEGVALIFVEKKNNELQLVYKEKRSTPEQLIEKPGKGCPVALIVNNNFVIQKEIDITESNEMKMLNKAFPNLKGDDFYYEISKIKSKTIVAICRKNYINELIERYKELDITFSHISLGICSLSQIDDYIVKDNIKTNHQIVSFNDEGPAVRNNENRLVEMYELNDLQVPNTYLMAFSGVINLVIKTSKNTGNITLLNAELSNTFNQKSFFTSILKAMVFFLLVLLLINFFAFNYYFKKANEQATDIEASKNIMGKITTIKKRLQIKEDKIKNTANGLASRSSLIINEVVKDLPSSILFNELIYHPLEKKIKPDEPITIQNNTIIISGVAFNNRDFTQWIENIESSKWIKSATITDYGKKENKETVFTVKLTITDEAK